MSTERWKRATLPSLRSASSVSSDTVEVAPDVQEATEHKMGRRLSKALRSMSNSSIESMAPSPSRGSARRLQKTPSISSSSMIERLHRRVSKDPGSLSSDATNAPINQPHHTMEVIQYGPLKADITLLKAKSEYLVLADQCLVRLGSAESARSMFPQLAQDTLQTSRATSSQSQSRSSTIDIRLEVPLRSIVAVFNEEGSSPRFGIEVWWFSPWPKLAYSKAHFFFSHPKERDEWLSSIQRACRARLRASSTTSILPENLRARINHIVAAAEPHLDATTQNPQSLVFPVARRFVNAAQKSGSAEEPPFVADVSSFYLVLGPYMCHFVEVLRADQTTPAGELRVKTLSFGTVTLTRFKASVASHEQRFVTTFRLPFGRETRFDLASTYYRKIIEAMTKADRILKPMWPQHFQHVIFEIKGLPSPLQLTSGNDLGGLEKSLQAYCVAFSVQVPRWKIEWSTPSQPMFRLLPMEGVAYAPLQLLAVFRALRYNSFFRAISLRDVNLSSLTSKKDYTHYGDCVVHTSLSGFSIPEELYDTLVHAPVLAQELHALLFASESIREIDFTNVWGPCDHSKPRNRAASDYATMRKMSTELLSAVTLLLRHHLSFCHSISLADNALASADVNELANVLVLDHVALKKLNLARCGMGDAELSKLWTGLAGQSETLETLDLSDNRGVVHHEIIRDTLSRLGAIRKLCIAGNTRLEPDVSLFSETTLQSWTLQELDLSCIALNDATVEVLAQYLETPESYDLQVLRLNQCGLTGRQIACLFRGMGQARRITVHINANRPDDGIDDLCRAIACGYGPWSLFAQMTEFALESSYVKLLRALTINKGIECLSLAGCSTPDAAGETTCQAIASFFADNTSVRYLDMSGYDSKLDEGRLGRGFSQALLGLRFNTAIQHLRVRSQMLNINVGDLAEAVSTNKTLQTLDCEGNDFNLSNFRHLVRHLEENMTIRYFSAFSSQELDRCIRRSVENASSGVPTRRASIIGRLRHDRSSGSISEGPLLQQLKDSWNTVTTTLDKVLERNLTISRVALGMPDDLMSPGGPEDDGRGIFAADFGGLALRDLRSRKAASSPGTETPFATGSTSMRASAELPQNKVSRSYSSVSSEIAISPTTSEGASSGSGIPTPPELESPTEREPGVSYTQSSEMMFDEPRDLSFGYSKGLDADAGLQMKPYRRFHSDSTSCILEEDDRAVDGRAAT